jgi:hypothetical protein
VTAPQSTICCRSAQNQQHSFSIQVSVTSFGTVPRGGQKSGENMKYLFAAVLVAGSFASFSAANAAGGCGPGWHRGPMGGCQPNRRVVVVERPAPAVVVRPGRVCGPGMVWRYGRCRLI